jgi:hypothetical protein
VWVGATADWAGGARVGAVWAGATADWAGGARVGIGVGAAKTSV